MTPARVEFAGDPRVADYRNVRDGVLLRDRGLFVVEGRANVRRLVRESPYRPRSLFLSEPAAAALSDVCGAVDADVPVYVAKRAVLSEIIGFDVHRGCLAVCDRPAPRPPDALLAPRGEASTVVVLEDLADPDNVGAVFRNALAFGADAVLLSPHCCDPLYRKAVRVSMGAALCVPTARFDAWPDGLDLLRGAGYRVVALHPGADAPLAVGGELPPRAALVLGSEGKGLSPGALARADARARIDMADGVDSLNVATASGIALHAAFASRGACGLASRRSPRGAAGA